MAANPSFDISTGVDLQEVDNAVNQANKEIAQRYDFKGTHCTIELDRGAGEIRLAADDEFRMKQLVDVLLAKCARRGLPARNVKVGDPVPSAGTSVKVAVSLTQGIDAETAKRITRMIKDQGFKKIQASIQGDEIRVTGPSRDGLQEVIAFLRAQDFGVELQFGNYRG